MHLSYTVHLANGTQDTLLSKFHVSFDGFQKQVAQYTKVISHVWDIANKAREEWESEAGSRATQAQTSSAADTHALVAAVGMGKGLKVIIFYFLKSQYINLFYLNICYRYYRSITYSPTQFQWFSQMLIPYQVV